LKAQHVKALVWPRLLYDLVATWDCHAFEYWEAPVIDRRPCRLGSGRMMNPGAMLKRAHGKRTSAGWSDFHLAEGAFRFLGFTPASPEPGREGEDPGELVLFDYVRRGRKVGPPLTFYGFHVVDEKEGVWAFCTPAVAGRLVETTLCEFAPGA
jgi:hypothetical protein